MAHDDARKVKWRGNWRMELVASTLHTTSKHGVSRITTAGAHTSAASSRLNWSPRRFKWTRPFRRKTKSGFCACAITFQTQSKAVALLFLMLPAIAEAFIMSSEESFYSLLVSVRVMSYQASCRNCIILTIICQRYGFCFSAGNWWSPGDDFSRHIITVTACSTVTKL